MLPIDPHAHLATRRHELAVEAERQRLIAQLPHQTPFLRRAIALACLRLANWLDEPAEYLPPPESGHAYWVKPRLSA